MTIVKTPNTSIREATSGSKRAMSAMMSALSGDQELRDRITGLSEEETAGVLEDRFWDAFPDVDVSEASKIVAAQIIKIANDPGTYIVNDSGQAIVKITPEMIYQPPDQINEDGSIRRLMPSLHPRISSGLALASQEAENISKLKKLVPVGMDESIAHIDDPWRIVYHAKKALEVNGISTDDPSAETEAIVEIGREQTSGLNQAPNFNFHRSVSYGSILAKKILNLGAKRCLFKSIDKKKNSKQSWIEVKVIYSNV